MKIPTALLFTSLLLAGPATAAGIAGAAEASDDAWRAGDAVARQEAPALRALYEDGTAAFARGDYASAFRDLDYAAWQGSVAAAMRLCVLDGYGIGTVPNALKAAFWCGRASEAGHGLRQVERHLEALEYVGR